MKKKFLILYLMISFCFLFNIPKTSVFAEGNTKEINIATSPHKVFFEITNGKPGDTYQKVLTVQNNGLEDFSYLFSNRFLTGSEKLYNELLLTVNDETGVLYKGQLKDFEKLNSRILKSNESEELTLSIYIPLELGNMYQGLNTEFQFKFYVEGTLGGILPADGPKLPATGTAMFNFLVTGGLLVIIGMLFQGYVLFKRRSNYLEL